MRTRRRPAARAWAIWVLALALYGSPARSSAGSSETWSEWKSTNFVLLSATTETTTRRVADWLETFRAVLPNITTNVDLNPPQPTVVYLFRNGKSFDAFKGKESVGVSVTQREANFIAVNALTYGTWSGKDAPPARDLYHEYTHILIRTNFANPPLWANEGLAEYYSTFRRRGRRGDVGRPIVNHVALLRTEPWYPLATLVALENKDDDPRLRRIFYAQSWAVVHYLVSSGPELAGRFHRYLHLADQGMSSRDAFESVFGADLSELEQAVRDHVSWNQFRFARIKVPSLKGSQTGAARVLPREEAATRLAELQSRTRPRESAAAEALFREALELRPDYAPALLGLGELLQRSGRLPEAETLLRRAVAADPSRASARYSLGSALLTRFVREGGQAPFTGDGPPDAVSEARGHFKASFTIDPRHGDALGAFGATYAFQPSAHQEGIAALESAAVLLPSRMDLIYTLLVLELLDGDVAAARRRAAQALRRAPEALVGALRAAVDALGERSLLGASARRDDVAAVVDVIEAELEGALADPKRRERIRQALETLRPPRSATPEVESSDGT